MANNKEYRERPANLKDYYKIGVTTIASLEVIKRGNLVVTGKETAGKVIGKDSIRSDELEEGMTINVENGGSREETR